MRVDIPEYNSSVEFPDDMPLQEIEKVLRANFPPISEIRNHDGSWKIDITQLPALPVIVPEPKRNMFDTIKETIGTGLTKIKENLPNISKGVLTGVEEAGRKAYALTQAINDIVLGGAGFTGGMITAVADVVSQIQEKPQVLIPDKFARKLGINPKDIDWKNVEKVFSDVSEAISTLGGLRLSEFQADPEFRQAITKVLMAPFELYEYGVQKVAEKIAPDDENKQAQIRMAGRALLITAPAIKKVVRSVIKKDKNKVKLEVAEDKLRRGETKEALKILDEIKEEEIIPISVSEESVAKKIQGRERIEPGEKIGETTLQNVVELIKEGKIDEAAKHIKEGIKKHGELALQDALSREEIDLAVKVPKEERIEISNKFKEAREKAFSEESEAELTELPKTETKTETVPSHVVNILRKPREVLLSVGVATKEHTLRVIKEHWKLGEIKPGMAIRFTTVDELNKIVTENRLIEGVDFEGKIGISAQVAQNPDAFVVYGDNNKVSAAIIFPEDAIVGKGMAPNEVKIHPDTPLEKLRFVVDGYDRLLTYKELVKIIKSEQKEVKLKPKSKQVPQETIRKFPENREEKVESEIEFPEKLEEEFENLEQSKILYAKPSESFKSEKGKEFIQEVSKPEPVQKIELSFPEETRLQRIRRLFEDYNIRLKVVMSELRKHGINIPPAQDLYRIQDMLPRVKADKLRRLYEKKIAFVEELVKNKVSLEELGEFVYARWAKTYNERVNKRRIERGLPPLEKPSGISNKEADEILLRYLKHPNFSQIQKFKKKVEELKKELIDFQKENGLISSEEYALYLRDPEYVPLQRDIEGAFGINIRGADVRGREYKTPKGSEKEVLNPVSNLFKAFENSILRLEAAQFGRTVIDLVKEYPQLRSIFEIRKEPKIPVGKSLHLAEVDVTFFENIVDFAKTLGLKEFETKGKIGKHLAWYKPKDKKIVRRFATSRETLAHEIGHFLDDKFGLSKIMYGVKEPTREIIEDFAQKFSWWLIHRDLAHQKYPEFSQKIESIINQTPELQPLLNIRPTQTQLIEQMEETIWGKKIFYESDEIGTIYKGDLYTIKIKDPLIARAVKEGGVTYSAGLARVLRYVGFPVRMMQTLVTKYRPDFTLIRNPIKDAGDALINIAVERGLLEKQKADVSGLRRELLKKIPYYQRKIYRYFRDKEKDPVVDRFLTLGGDIGRFYGESFTKAEMSLYELEKRLKNEGIQKPLNLLRRFDEWIDAVNKAMELGTRVAAFDVLVKRGMDELSAIQAVADLTINFARQGEFTPLLKPIKMFINPSIQGLSKHIRVLSNPVARKRIVEVIAGLIGMGYITRMVADMIDPDGNKQISQYAKDTTITIPFNGKQYTFWILPYGWNVFYALGGSIYDIQNQHRTIKDSTISLVDQIITSYSPVGGSLKSAKHPVDILVDTAVPDPLMPLLEISRNRSWLGGQIRPEDRFAIAEFPKYQRYFMHASKGAILTAKYLHHLFNIDLSPNDIDYALRQYFGGAYEMLWQAPSGIGELISKGEVKTRDVPLLKQFVRELEPDRFVISTINDILEKAGKKVLSEIERKQFKDALTMGLKTGVITPQQANNYAKRVMKAQALHKIGIVPLQKRRELIYQLREAQ